jgi:chromosome segregation ATPase
MEQQPSTSGPGIAEATPPQAVVDEGQTPPVDEAAQEPSTGDVFMEEILLVDALEHVALPSADIGDVQEQAAEEAEVPAPQDSSVKPSQRVQEARAVAEAAEENARRAFERSAEAAARMEQIGSGRHLMQELLEMQAEADRASTIAQAAERAAEEAEQEESVLREQDSPVTSADDIAEIEEEEEMVETLAAKTIAEIAAERAASAEAIAEASSVHTREARRRMHVAELALGQVRLAIRNGTLSGEEAEVALQDAEDELTRASAFLADAEATEEQALNNAMNAEAEAEVAEGMAYAAEQELEDREQEPLPDVSTAEDAPAEEDNESASTQKLPVVHPPESL